MDSWRLAFITCVVCFGLSGSVVAQDETDADSAAGSETEVADSESSDSEPKESDDAESVESSDSKPAESSDSKPADGTTAQLASDLADLAAKQADPKGDEAQSEEVQANGADAEPSQAQTNAAAAGSPSANTPAMPPELPRAPAPADTVDLSDIMALLNKQNEELAAQRRLLEGQGKVVDQMRQELDALRAPPVVEAQTTPEKTIQALDNREAPSDIDDSQPPGGDTGARVATGAGSEKPGTSPDDAASDAARKEVGDQVADAQTDDPTRDSLEDFVGSWRLPGTTAALRIGGHVKASLVNNFDPMEISDRFIVGSIPVGFADPGVEAESSITANKSRLNFDLREPTKVGLLRAFIEGDFVEDGDTFRLRHAFGQWNRVLAGKTWSAFVDTQATPEEIDFEGLNGRINVRQSQIRLMPRLGRQLEFQLSLEDPDPDLEDGEGVSQLPDLVASGRIQLRDDLHVKIGAIVRQIRGQWDSNPGNTEEDVGWGLTVSGRFDWPLFDERDSVLFQLNRGKGIGRYVNDLRSVGDFDARFNPVTGELELIDVLAGYVSGQHWWGETLRSNLTVGYVAIDYSGFELPDDYEATLRVSTNMLWSPTPRIDVGGELLWGRRENQDGEQGDATQIQFSAKYRF